MPLAPGTRLGHYELTALIGSGGMGDVYHARDPRLERDVAIKIVRALDAAPDARARFWREARAAASINHPAVCQVYDVGQRDEAIFIVMELLQGRSLADRIADGPVPVTEAAQIALSLLGALEALHRRDLVHRDIKPSNVILAETGVKLLDFGLARPFGAIQADVTQTGTIVGTPRYMAPEQWSGTPPDRRSDLFATAAILYEMLTGQPAFPGHELMAVYHAVMSAQPPALSGSPVITAVDGVIHRALEKRPQDRYDTAEDMARALRTAVSLGGDSLPVAVRRSTRLVVLPFRILRPDPDLDLLSFGLPDAIVSSLADLPSLVVRSPLAGAKYVGTSIDLKGVAADLAVDAVVCGTLLRAGDQVRVSAQMLEVPSGTIKCSKTLQVAIGDLFAIQDQLARAVVDALAIPLAAGDTQRLHGDLPATARAYELYLRANHVSYDSSMLPVAAQLYRSALDEDPRYAPAWARLGRVYRLLSKYGPDEQVDDYLAQAGEAFTRAFDLDPDCTVAHHLYTNFEVESLGRAKAATIRLLQRLQRRSGDPELFAGLVLSCRFCGLLDASLAADRQARRLDPMIRTSVNYTHFMLGDWERAIASDVEDARWVTKYALPLIGREEEALAAHRAAEERPLPVHMRRLMRLSRFALERRQRECVDEALAMMAGRAFDPEGRYLAARGLIHVGALDEGLALLAQLVEPFACPSILLCDPWLDPVRGHAPFNAIVARATILSRDARDEFRRAGGDQLLGLTG